MKKLFLTFVLIITVISSYSQDTIVAWTFPNGGADSLVDVAIAINTSCYLQTENSLRPITYNITGASGTPDKAAQSIAWHNGNGIKYWQVDFKTANYNNLKLTSKQSSCGTHLAPRDFKVQYKLFGEVIWTDVPGATIIDTSNWTMGVLNNIDLPSACNNQVQSLSLRWIMTSNTNILGNNVDSVGMSRIDDIIITGTYFNYVEDISENDFINIYPNPTGGIFRIQNTMKIQSVEIYNISEKKVYAASKNKQQTSIEINLSGLPKGIYIAKIYIGSKIYNKKIFLQ